MSFKCSLAFFFFLLVSSLLNAQVLNVSPYSTYGIGDVNTRNLVASRGMGGVQTALYQFDYFNPKNPAGNAFLTKPLFDLGVRAQSVRLAGPSGSASSAYNNINHFALAFPFAKRFALTALLSPHTTLGYELTQELELPKAGTVETVYKGIGGLNRASLGFSAQIIQDTLNQLSLGANFSYYFGFFDRTTELRFIDQPGFLNSITSDNISTRGINGEYGLAYRRGLKSNNFLSLGASFEPQRKLASKKVSSTFIFVAPEFTGSASDVVDTLIATPDTGDVVQPMNYSLGASLNLNRKWTVGIEYDFWEWSKLEILGNNPALANSFSLGVGIEFWPDYRASSDLLKSGRYRTGFRYGQSRVILDDLNLNEFGISFGFALPLLKSRSFSSLNVALEYGQRGSEKRNSFSESFTSVNIGVTLMPNQFDRWFYKRKIE